MRFLAFGEVRDCDVDYRVVLELAVVVEGRVEDGEDFRGGAVDPGADDADGFLGVVVAVVWGGGEGAEW